MPARYCSLEFNWGIERKTPGLAEEVGCVTINICLPRLGAPAELRWVWELCVGGNNSVIG